MSGPASAKKKKVAPAPAPAPKPIDYSRLQYPPAPEIARVKYLDALYGAKLEPPPPNTKKKSWMDAMAGTQEDQRKGQRHIPPQLVFPIGLAVDSKGLLYVSDQKTGGIFIFNTETKDTQFIRNGRDANFKLVNGIAIDDNDRLFVADGQLHHVLVFDAQHKPVDEVSQDMQDPVGLAIDTENRFLYVVDEGLDQVLVYDADSFKLLRKIGTTGHNHELTTEGNFGAPFAAAVDKDSNLYVSDMLNNRIEMFDADGNFIRTWGKIGDAPGNSGGPRASRSTATATFGWWTTRSTGSRFLPMTAPCCWPSAATEKLPRSSREWSGSPSIKRTGFSLWSNTRPAKFRSSVTSRRRRRKPSLSVAKRNGKRKRLPDRGISRRIRGCSRRMRQRRRPSRSRNEFGGFRPTSGDQQLISGSRSN